MTPERCAQVVAIVAEGLFVNGAARACGIPPATVKAHRHRHAEFATALKKAEATAELSWLRTVVTAADKNWTAAMTLLERKYPERWARREVIKAEVTSPLKPDPRFA